MSYSKNDQLFPGEASALAAQKITQSISDALHCDYGEFTSAVKRIGRITGVHPRAIRNWYEGRNAPNSVHLLMLARSSPNVLQVLLELVGRGDMAEAIKREFHPPNKPSLPLFLNAAMQIYSENFFTINVTINAERAAKLNERQLWFLGLIQRGYDIRSSDIVAIWNITTRTAKADVAGLKKLRLVCFKGARKNGRYEALH